MEIMRSKKFIIITSIFQPTVAVKKIATMSDYQLIVVGDNKSPSDWQCENVIYLSVADQQKLDYPILKDLPYNHYCRKMIGYLFAIEHGAEIIIDTDDDNIPYDNWGFPEFEGEFECIERDKGFMNIYSEFTAQKIWPRGLPLSLINSPNIYTKLCKKANIGIWQGLADGDPDVDAIYRLTDNTPCHFNKRAPIIIDKGTISPFNSQNTAFAKELFPLLYLPSFVSFRFTDILRGIVAQPVMWQADYLLGFTEATVVQERNVHNYMKDFELEIPMYQLAERSFQIALDAVSRSKTITQNIFEVYLELHRNDAIVSHEEILLLEKWLKHFNKK
jgi:hypothetical protein